MKLLNFILLKARKYLRSRYKFEFAQPGGAFFNIVAFNLQTKTAIKIRVFQSHILKFEYVDTILLLDHSFSVFNLSNYDFNVFLCCSLKVIPFDHIDHLQFEKNTDCLFPCISALSRLFIR